MSNFEIETGDEQESYATKRGRRKGNGKRVVWLLVAWISGAAAAVGAASLILQHVKHEPPSQRTRSDKRTNQSFRVPVESNGCGAGRFNANQREHDSQARASSAPIS